MPTRSYRLEDQLRDMEILPALRKVNGLEFVRIENKIGHSTPDLIFSYKGRRPWVEIKVGPDIGHFTKGQRSFLRRHGESSGYAFLVLQVSEWLYVVDHKIAVDLPYYIDPDRDLQGVARLPFPLDPIKFVLAFLQQGGVPDQV